MFIFPFFPPTPFVFPFTPLILLLTGRMRSLLELCGWKKTSAGSKAEEQRNWVEKRYC